MTLFTLQAHNITKSYTEGKKIIEVSFFLQNRDLFGITGDNGSGKSTLIKIISGALQASSGNIELIIDNKKTSDNDYKLHFGLVAPYLKLYDEFNPLELIKILCKLRGFSPNNDRNTDLLKTFDLFRRRFQPVKTFSSGMKQRMQYVLALIHNPEILLLDEPSSNLDKEGIAVVENQIKEHIEQGGAVIIATNESREADLCNKIIKL